jgi:hypothetical protein
MNFSSLETEAETGKYFHCRKYWNISSGGVVRKLWRRKGAIFGILFHNFLINFESCKKIKSQIWP